MNQRRIFTAINLLLVAGSGFLIYYLANAAYVEPPEIRQARERMKGTETEFNIEGPQAAPGATVNYDKLGNVQIFTGLYTPTPAPTQPPKPTPTPVPLAMILHPWTIVSMDRDVITILDQAAAEEFEMRVGGPPRTMSNAGGTATMSLESIDVMADPPVANLKSQTGESYQLKFE
jgi:hypothetical protein